MNLYNEEHIDEEQYFLLLDFVLGDSNKELEVVRIPFVQWQPQCCEPKEWVVRTVHQLNRIILFLDTLEVHHVPESVYVVTRSEEHSDYVEAVFLNEDKAEEYCKPFNEDENCYARNITKVKIQ